MNILVAGYFGLAMYICALRLNSMRKNKMNTYLLQINTHFLLFHMRNKLIASSVEFDTNYIFSNVIEI